MFLAFGARLLFSGFLLFIFGASTPAWSQAVEPDAKSELDAASAFVKSGKFVEAAAKYRAILDRNPNATQAQAGMVRSILAQERLQEASELGTKYLAAAPAASELHTAMAEVHFRLAEMREAELDFRTAFKQNPLDVQAYIGLADLYNALGAHRHAYDLLVKARDVAPDDPDVQRKWISLLPRNARAAAIEAYLSAMHSADPETNELRDYLDYLKSSTADHKTHACAPAQSLERTQTELVPLMLDPLHLRGWGLRVQLNNHIGNFLLDTGAHGLYISRRQAEKAGVVRISQDRVSGIGDQGAVTGYYGYVERLQIGDVQFRDCIIEVSDKRSVADEDGLIGADVFASYIVNLDFREHRMRLEPLPARPGEQQATKALNSEGDDTELADAGSQAAAEDKSESIPEAINIRTYVPKHLPVDRYIAPEMKTWTPIYRFGHEMLLTARVNDLENKLFLVDTGAFNTTFSTSLASELGKIHRDAYTTVHGVSGKVEKVYYAKDADMVFGHMKQRIEEAVTFDLSNISRDIGTEVSGIIGFVVLNMMDVQIDYRDNLINFNYDPKKLGLPSFKK